MRTNERRTTRRYECIKRIENTRPSAKRVDIGPHPGGVNQFCEQSEQIFLIIHCKIKVRTNNLPMMPSPTIIGVFGIVLTIRGFSEM